MPPAADRFAYRSSGPSQPRDRVPCDPSSALAPCQPADAGRLHGQRAPSARVLVSPALGEKRVPRRIWHDCFRPTAVLWPCDRIGDIPRPREGRPRRRRGARSRGRPPAARRVTDAAPATALRPEGPCSAGVRRCRDCPIAVLRAMPAKLPLLCLLLRSSWLAVEGDRRVGAVGGPHRRGGRAAVAVRVGVAAGVAHQQSGSVPGGLPQPPARPAVWLRRRNAWHRPFH